MARENRRPEPPTVVTSLVRVGRSLGVRIPRPLREQAELSGKVELTVEGRALVIRSADGPRAGWSEAFRRMAGRDEGALLDAETPTRWDEEEWQWR